MVNFGIPESGYDGNLYLWFLNFMLVENIAWIIEFSSYVLLLEQLPATHVQLYIENYFVVLLAYLMFNTIVAFDVEFLISCEEMQKMTLQLIQIQCMLSF
jgi:hypothetical protein